MSDFGFWELALIMLIALLIVGPERLPRLMSSVGHWIGRIKKLTAQLKAEFAEQSQAQEVKKILSDTQETVNKAGADIKREFVNTDPLVKAIEDQIDEGRFAPDSKTDNVADNEQQAETKEVETAEKKQQRDHDR